MKGRLLAVAGLVLSVSPLSAQSETALDMPRLKEELGKSFAEVSSLVMKSADMVPADKYTYRPVATVRTFGELVAHVADSYTWYCSRASGRNLEWSDAIEKGEDRQGHSDAEAERGDGRVHGRSRRQQREHRSVVQQHQPHKPALRQHHYVPAHARPRTAEQRLE